MKEKLMSQVSILERAAGNEDAVVDLDAVRVTMFDAAQKIEVLEKDLASRDASIAELTPLSEIEKEKIAEVKADTLRMLTVICEHSEDKDMGRADRMKERFEKEALDFTAIKRYRDDAQAEFDKLFPENGNSRAKEIDAERAAVANPDVGAYKIKGLVKK